MVVVTPHEETVEPAEHGLTSEEDDVEMGSIARQFEGRDREGVPEVYVGFAYLLVVLQQLSWGERRENAEFLRVGCKGRDDGLQSYEPFVVVFLIEDLQSKEGFI